MRRMIAFLLAAVTLFSMVACSKKAQDPTPITASTTTTAPTVDSDTNVTPSTDNETESAATEEETLPPSADNMPSRPAPASRTTRPAVPGKVTQATASDETTATSVTTKATKPVNTTAAATTATTKATQPTKQTTATAAATNPAKPIQAKYDSSEDAPFLPKDIYTKDLYYPGMVLSGSTTVKNTDQANEGAFVVAAEYGKCYEVKIPAGVPFVIAAKFTSDPRSLAVGQKITGGTELKSAVSNPTREISFMYVCRAHNEYMVVYTGSADPIYIGERTIIQDTDTQGPWYIPEPVGSVIADKTLGDANWTSEQFFDNLYEPLRQKYPDYITRSNIGKDATGEYDMYCYVYEPEDYETTLFLTGGTHGDEIVGYFALAKTMQLIADATPEDVLLYEMRQKVRFVVIPLVNVWSVSNTHTRYNGNGQDLNRDYSSLSQQESQNVMACFAQYAEDVDVVMDFHIADSCPSDVAMYFNFINYTDNAVANYKTTNHMYHRYRELGYAKENPDLSRVPGSYEKGSQYFEGRIWNQYGIPTITVEYLVTSNFPKPYYSECMTLAVETYSNFIIQNALFFIEKN